jgi:hypothetical protein
VGSDQTPDVITGRPTTDTATSMPSDRPHPHEAGSLMGVITDPADACA